MYVLHFSFTGFKNNKNNGFLKNANKIRFNKKLFWPESTYDKLTCIYKETWVFNSFLQNEFRGVKCKL